MKYTDDYSEVRMTLYEYSQLQILPRDFWIMHQSKPQVIEWLRHWPKTWRWQKQNGVWHLAHLHIGLTGRAYFYYPRIILRPTPKELAYIEEETYRIGYRNGRNSFGRPPVLNIPPRETFHG